MLVIQDAQLQDKFNRNNGLMIQGVEAARQLDEGPSVVIINILMTVLFLAASGSLMRAVVLMLG